MPHCFDQMECINIDRCAREGRCIGENLPEVYTVTTPTPDNSQVAKLAEALRNLLVMLPSDHEDRPNDERIPAAYCYVRWVDIREAKEALARAAAPVARVPDGWKLVPAEPTREMELAGADTPGMAEISASSATMQARRYPLNQNSFKDGNAIQQAYRAMLAAAPPAPLMANGLTEAPVARLRSEGDAGIVVVDEVYRPMHVGTYEVYLRPAAPQAQAAQAQPAEAWSAGTEDCDGNPLVTVRADQLAALVEFADRVSMTGARIDGDMVSREELIVRLRSISNPLAATSTPTQPAVEVDVLRSALQRIADGNVMAGQLAQTLGDTGDRGGWSHLDTVIAYQGLARAALATRTKAASAVPESESRLAIARAPIDMVLHCPACGLQHIDASEERELSIGGNIESGTVRFGWDNPPHRSHLCHGCGHIWRPADVATNGVAATATSGKNDSPIATIPAPSAAKVEGVDQ